MLKGGEAGRRALKKREEKRDRREGEALNTRASTTRVSCWCVLEAID